MFLLSAKDHGVGLNSLGRLSTTVGYDTQSLAFTPPKELNYEK